MKLMTLLYQIPHSGACGTVEFILRLKTSIVTKENTLKQFKPFKTQNFQKLQFYTQTSIPTSHSLRGHRILKNTKFSHLS